jgi:hypothetical protein
VFIRACFDESIRQDFDEPICVGGYLFKQAAYEKFKRQWHRTVLHYGKRRFTAFHMFDLFAGNDEYEGLLAEDRAAILDAAVSAIGAHAHAGVGTYFDQAEFERSVPADWAQRYGSIYALACNLCLQATGYWLDQWQCPMRVDYLFEHGHKHLQEATRGSMPPLHCPDREAVSLPQSRLRREGPTGIADRRSVRLHDDEGSGAHRGQEDLSDADPAVVEAGAGADTAEAPQGDGREAPKTTPRA